MIEALIGWSALSLALIIIVTWKESGKNEGR